MYRNMNRLQGRDVYRLTVSVARMSAGRWFQPLGPATANDWAPKCMTVGLMMRSLQMADRSLCSMPLVDTGRRGTSVRDREAL